MLSSLLEVSVGVGALATVDSCISLNPLCSSSLPTDSTTTTLNHEAGTTQGGSEPFLGAKATSTLMPPLLKILLSSLLLGELPSEVYLAAKSLSIVSKCSSGRGTSRVDTTAAMTSLPCFAIVSVKTCCCFTNGSIVVLRVVLRDDIIANFQLFHLSISPTPFPWQQQWPGVLSLCEPVHHVLVPISHVANPALVDDEDTTGYAAQIDAPHQNVSVGS
ncbi:hypothetical protein SEMRO_85_G045471.1 [Seminavis robusta]|uniref:Uncharacterized protein n=1 Tax=Seminavis robusta TaxID=568900 RepID=A0A9N8DCZ8_9STRA|nr:hypothetical protein SEMRO_85_G045471.1 [Seminavis robusta]|eukprot:Sro85_g045471.1  (218) ;mRNA; f:93779-94432